MGKALETVNQVKSKKIHDIRVSAGKMPSSNAKESKSSARVEMRWTLRAIRRVAPATLAAEE